MPKSDFRFAINRLCEPQCVDEIEQKKNWNSKYEMLVYQLHAFSQINFSRLFLTAEICT